MVDTAAQLKIIARLIEKLRAGYVLTDAVEAIVSAIKKHLNAKEYADIMEDEFFAFALTTHLQEFNHDEHLWVKYHPEELPDTEDPSHKSREWLERQKQQAHSEQFGIHKLEQLTEGVSVMDIRYLHRAEWAGGAIRDAFAQAADSAALILDLRNCLGGYPATVALFCSHLFAEPAMPILRVYWRDEDRTQEFNTLPTPPKDQFLKKPVCALIGKSTFSAGEALALVLHSRRRAILVGEQTNGGSHAIVTFRLHPHFELSLPVGQTFDALTGREWEGVGVMPDVSASPDHAFTAAIQGVQGQNS